MYKVFGGRQQYLDTPESEILEQVLVWQAEQRAMKEQRRRDLIQQNRELEDLKKTINIK